MLSKELLFRTPVGITLESRRFRVEDRYVFLGSCFSENIGGLFRQYGLSALSNPLGVLYNPMSISGVVGQALHPETARLPLFEHDGRWCCWLAGTQLYGDTEESCKERVGEAFARLGCALKKATCLMLTLGTPVTYILKSTGQTVANCHKVPADCFTERRLDVSACTEALTAMVQDLTKVNPEIRIVFTISPYRYAKYGFHGNQLAKATLLLAVDNVCRMHPHVCSYLPIYEIFMDELRDYRFYASDMLHPNEIAVDYIWHRLKTDCMDERMQQYLVEAEPVRKFLLHRPSEPHSAKYQEQVQKNNTRIKELREKYGVPAADSFVEQAWHTGNTNY